MSVEKIKVLEQVLIDLKGKLTEHQGKSKQMHRELDEHSESNPNQDLDKKLLLMNNINALDIDIDSLEKEILEKETELSLLKKKNNTKVIAPGNSVAKTACIISVFSIIMLFFGGYYLSEQINGLQSENMLLQKHLMENGNNAQKAVITKKQFDAAITAQTRIERQHEKILKRIAGMKASLAVIEDILREEIEEKNKNKNSKKRGG